MLLGKSWLCWQVISQRLELSIEKGKSVLPVPILFEEYQLPKREKCTVYPAALQSEKHFPLQTSLNRATI